MYPLPDHLTFDAAGRQFVFVVASSALFEVEGPVDEATWAELASVGATRRLRDTPPDDGSLATLVLQLRRSCNLRCAYCYCDPEPGDGAPDRMSMDTARAAVDLLFAHLPPDGPAGITFFGGEPLLELPLLRATAAHAQKRAAELAREVHFSLTTNGTTVTAEAADLLADIGARVTVSIDGDRGRHDAHRVFGDGSGSYEAVRAGVRLLERGLRPSARATITATAPDPVPVVDHLLEMGFHSVGVSVADVADPSLALDDAGLEVLEVGMERLADRYLAEALAGRHLGFANLDGLLRTLHRGLNRDFPCGAGLRLACCDTDGTLYACHRLAGRSRYAMGSVDGGLDRRDLVRDLSLGNRTGCHGCWARHLCGGGCHHARLVEGRDEAQLRVCAWLRRWMRKGLQVYAELMVHGAPFLAEFVDPAPPCAVE
jgi:uncharacterized protein